MCVWGGAAQIACKESKTLLSLENKMNVRSYLFSFFACFASQQSLVSPPPAVFTLMGCSSGGGGNELCVDFCLVLSLVSFLHL